MSTYLRFGLLLAAAGAAGCGSKPPTAELVSWRTTREPLPTAGGTLKLKKDGEHFAVVRLRGTGTGLYRQSADDKTMYALRPGDFTLSAPDGQTAKAVAQRNVASREFGGDSYRDKPGKEEEVEVAFVIDAALAERGDLVLRYQDLPAITLAQAQKQK